MRDCLNLGSVAVVIVALLPRVAQAQEFLEDRSAAEGPGFKVGRFVLHPGVAVEGGYDSNVFLQSDNLEDSFILRATGYLDFATLSPQRKAEGESNEAAPEKISFRGGLGGSYYHYFNGRVGDNASADAHFNFAYTPSPMFTLRITEVFARTVRPFTDPNTLVGETVSYGRNNNDAGLAVVVRSRSQVLEGQVGYTNSVGFFDSTLFQYGNSVTHRVPALFSWRFFPTSAIVYEFEYAAQRFLNPDEATAATALNDNNRVRSLVGYNGSITNRLALTALVGYAAGFFEALQDFDGPIARVEARWRPRGTISLAGGYTHDIVSSFIGNFTRMHRLHLNTTFTVAGAFLLGLRAWVSFDKSGLALTPQGTPLGSELERQDIRTQITLFGEYRFRSWLSVFSELGYLADFTDFTFTGIDPLLDPLGDYQRFEAWIGFRVFY